MSKKLKDKLEDGNGTMLISFFILLVSLLISIICIEMGNLLTNKSKTQVWADAAANTIAAARLAGALPPSSQRDGRFPTVDRTTWHFSPSWRRTMKNPAVAVGDGGV